MQVLMENTISLFEKAAAVIFYQNCQDEGPNQKLKRIYDKVQWNDGWNDQQDLRCGSWIGKQSKVSEWMKR